MRILFIGGKRCRASFLFLQDWLKNFWWCKPLRRHLKESSVLHPESSPIPSTIGSNNSWNAFFSLKTGLAIKEQFDLKQAVEEAEK
jgi:hypothetical protein